MPCPILRRAAAALVLALALAPPGAVPPAAAEPVPQGPPNVPEFSPAFPNQTRAPAMRSGFELAVEVLATGLEHPWGIEVLPGGGYLVTERPGRLRAIDAAGTLLAPLRGVPEVVAERQGGLLDVALAEDFETSRMLYLAYAKPMAGGRSATAVARARLAPDLSALTDVTDIFVQWPPSPNPMHFGARVVPAGEHLFVTLGEHSSRREREFAQHLDKTYGKVVRIGPDGSVPPDNPFAGLAGADPAVWALGLRNPQGADLHPGTGALWTLEHGPRGGDELNLIEKGGNYGWPVVSYGEEYSGRPVGAGLPRAPGFMEPRYYWDPVIAPGGFAFYDGQLFEGWQGNILAASLNPGGIVRLALDGDTVTGEERLLPELGRVRDVEVDADGALLIVTDRRDGELLRLTPTPRGG